MKSRACSGQRSEMSVARALWGPLSRASARALEDLMRSHNLSVRLGDVLYLERLTKPRLCGNA